MKKSILIIMAMGMLIGQVDYVSQIQTVIDANCTNSGCHTNGGGYQNGLDLSSYDNLMTGDSENGPVIIPLDHANSLLWQKVNSGVMPPGNNPDLSGDEVNLIASWIDEGALETPAVDVTGLFFSEYGEGSSNNKYLEIYNGTGTDVDLTGLAFPNVSNDPSTVGEYEYWNTFPDGATVAAGDVYVIAHGEADEAILAEADFTFTYLSNGNDGFCLVEGDEGAYTIVDCIGDWNGNPGDGWDVAGVVEATKDHTLVRKASVTEGNDGDWTSSAGTNEDDSEWVVLDQNTWDYLGSHPHDLYNDDISIEITSPSEGETIFTSGTTIEFSVSNFSVGATGSGADGHIHYQYAGGDVGMHYSTDPIELTDLTDGDYVLGLWLVDNDHQSLDPNIADTVNFTVSMTFTAIHDIQYVADPDADDASPLNGQAVTINGVVTAEFWGSDQYRYMHVQDAEGPWNGIVCFEYDGWHLFDWVDDNGSSVSGPAEGDQVTLTGTVEEYYNLTELASITSGIVHGPADEMISPSVVTVGDIGEAYEGCLIEVHDVTVSDPDLGYGEWQFTDGTNSALCDDKWDYFYYPESDQELAAITGILDYNYSNYKLQPRLARDVVETDGDPVRLQRIQQVLYSDLMKAGEDEESDMSYMVDETVTIEGIVTMPSGLSYAGAGVKFIFADVHGGPWSAILSYDPDSAAFPTLFEGDLIQATGYIAEYSTGPANMTELFITEPINIIDFEQPLPAVDTVNTGDLLWPTEAEQWGNVMVRIEDGIVTNNDLQYEVFAVDDGTGSVLVDDDSDSIAAYFETVGPPPVGSLVQSMEGWLYHHYGSNADSTAYKLCPLYVEDIEFGSGPPSITNLSREPCAPTASDNEVAVSCVILDNSTISEALVHYSVDGGDYVSVAMTSANDSTFTGVIPVANTNTVYYYITATDDGVDQSEPKTSVYPNNTDHDQLGFHVSDNLTIGMVQETPWPSGNTLYEGCNVTLTGSVTADTAQYTSGYSSYAFQDGTGQWNGLVFDTEEMAIVTRGDEVSVTGLVTDNDPDWVFKFGGNTRLINATVSVTSTGNDSPAPTGVSASDLAQTAEEVESYEGVLVKLDNVTVSAVNQYDWSITDASGMEALIDEDMGTMGAGIAMSELVEGQELSYIMGIFNYSFGTYKVQIRDVADLGTTVGIDDDVKVNPYEYALHDNFPNPFNPETQIRFSLGGRENVKLVIYDIMGRQVRTLANGDSFNSGFHVLNWDGRDNIGEKVATGMYIYRIKAGDFIADKKMLLVK